MGRGHGGVGVLTVGLMVAGLLPAVIPSAAAAPDYCSNDTVDAADLPEQVSLDDCDLVGRTVTAAGLRLTVPPPGEGRSIVAVSADGEVSFELSTSAEGIVDIAVDEIGGDDHAHEGSDADVRAAANLTPVSGGDNFADATPMAISRSFEPQVGLSSELDRATVEPGEPTPGCDTSAVGSQWYRIQRSDSWRRIKLRTDAPAAVYRGSELTALRRVACLRASPQEKLITMARTGAYYVQVAVTPQHQFTPALVLWLRNGEMRPDGAPPCDVKAHKLVDDITARKALRWRFNAASTPPALTRKQAARGVKRGMNIIMKSKNDCGLKDTVSARHKFLGRTKKSASLCTGRADGVNTVAFGPAPFGMLGLACSAWTINGRGKRVIFESDMRLTSGVTWTMKPDNPGCSNAVDIVGVVAHEAGHIFGLDHTGGVKGLNQTMAPSGSACNGAARTLGKGDVRGLRRLY